MDLRIEKTKKSIINSFLALRSKKELEEITIKELCEMAQINKSTFYAHYHDIYDLSEQLEKELVTSLMEEIRHPENVINDPAAFSRELFEGCLAKSSLMDILFSGNRNGFLIERIEAVLKETIHFIPNSTMTLYRILNCPTLYMVVIMLSIKTENMAMIL